MSDLKLRAEIKKTIDRLPPERLPSVADYVSFLARPSVERRVATAQKAVGAGRVVNWRKVRADV